MALVGTISGSNNTSNTAITGTLVIANVAASFPVIPSDAILFVSGNIGGNEKSVFGGDVQISGSSMTNGNVTTSGSLRSIMSVGSEGEATGQADAQSEVVVFALRHDWRGFRIAEVCVPACDK